MILDMQELLKGIKCVQMKGKWGSRNNVMSNNITCVLWSSLYLINANSTNSAACAYKVESGHLKKAGESFTIDVVEALPMLKTFSGEVELELEQGNIRISQLSSVAHIPILVNHEAQQPLEKFSDILMEYINNGFGEEFSHGKIGKYDHSLTVGVPALSAALKACDTTGSSHYELNCESNCLRITTSVANNRKMERAIVVESLMTNPATVTISAPINVLFQNDEVIQMQIHDEAPLFARSESAAIIVAPYITS